MSTGTYTSEQQIAAFTFSVNSAADHSFTSVSEMQTYVTKMAQVNLNDTVMQGFMGTDWDLVWGPTVWVNPSQAGPNYVADNTMSCYYSPSQSLFVIAVAGTNPNSMFDWEKEDFAISTMVEWNTISPSSGASSGRIAQATATGMNVLLGMKATNITLIEALATYIQSNEITGATIAVGGHSLGGALAPCLGLYLFDNLSTLGLSGQNIAVYAYAGPTPGDQVFATYYEGRINSTTFSYSSSYNSLDVIPLGSVLADLATIPTLYDGSITFHDTPKNTFMGVFVTTLELASLVGAIKSSPYTQVSTNRTKFNGTFNTDVQTNCANEIAKTLNESTFFGVSSTYMTELSNFISVMFQASAQHGPAYCGGTITFPLPTTSNPSATWTSLPIAGELKIDDYTAEYQANLAANPPVNANVSSGIAQTIKRISGFSLATLPARSELS